MIYKLRIPILFTSFCLVSLLVTGYSQDADLNRIVGQIQSVYSVDLDSDITYILYETHMSIPPLSFYYGVKYLLQ